MDVKGPSGPSNTDKVGKTKKSGGTSGAAGAFSAFLDETEGASTPSGVSTAAPATSLDSLLALQGIDPEQARKNRKREVERGESILDALSEIRVGILTGMISGPRLIRLQQLVEAQRAEVDDPRLIEIMDEIEIRAAVELAKLDMI